MATEFTLNKFDSGMHYVLLDEVTVWELTKNNNKRAICKINDEVAFHCALMKKKEGGCFVNVALPICKKLKISKGSKITATFSIDETQYQFEMPEELKEVLNTDLEADQLFHALTKGNQRSLIYLVSQVKSSDKKIERALKIAEKIKNGITSARVILK